MPRTNPPRDAIDELLFEAQLEFREDSPKVSQDAPRLGDYIGSGVGRSTGPGLEGTIRFDLFENQGEAVCDANLRGVIESSDGATIGFDVLGFFRRIGEGTRWTLSAAVKFETDDARYGWLTQVTARWEGETDMQTYRHSARIVRSAVSHPVVAARGA